MEGHQQLAPMWVVHISEILKMKGIAPYGAPPDHQQLKEAGLIVEWEPSFLTIFVSHQWLGKHHPDQKGSQFKVLQRALENLLGGRLQIEMDLPMQFLGETQVLSAANRASLSEAYIWFDWFSIPKIDSKQGSEEMRDDVFLAVQSIPFYVESCQLFIALAPTLKHNDLDEECNYCTWLQRGWCSLEIWCNLLSRKSDTPMILIRSSDHAEFAMPIHWVYGSPHTGNFAVEADRQKVTKVMQQALDSKLQFLHSSGQNQETARNFNRRV